MRCPWLLAQTKVATIFGIFGPSGVRALPVAAGTNEGGHYYWYFFLFIHLVLISIAKMALGGVVGF